MSPARRKKLPERSRWWSIALSVLLAAGIFVIAGQAVRWAKERPDWGFDPLRLGLRGASPAWLEPPLSRAFYASYEQAAGAPFVLHDLESFRAWVRRVQEIPWIERFDARPHYPDRVLLDIELRRPRVAIAHGRRLVLADRQGAVLPLLPRDSQLDFDLEARLARASRAEADLPPGAFDLPWVLGLRGLDRDRAALRGACLLAEEWRRDGRALLERFMDGVRAPALLAVDCSNHGLRASTERSEYTLYLVSSDQRPVRVAWGHAPEGDFDSRIPLEEKVRILSLVLRQFRGLEGVAACDVRFVASWRSRVVAAAR